MREFKTVRSSTSGPRSFRAWNDWDKGDALVLKYVGTVENKFDKSKNKEKPNYLFKILEVVELKNKKFKFEHSTLCLNTCGKFKYLMESLLVQPGEVVLFKYAGKSTLESGDYEGTEAHDFEMEVIDYDLPEGNGYKGEDDEL